VLSDFSAGMLRAARQNTLGRLPVANIDAQAIPFPDSCFDAVLANHMLYHVPDQPRAVAEIRRVLKPGGRLYAATNGATHMTDLDRLIERLAPALAPSRDAEVMRWRTSFTLENGAALLHRSFDEVRVERYMDDLRIDAARPVVDYTLSMVANSAQDLPREQVEAFEAALERELALHSSIFIHKDAGLFICSTDPGKR
jgi:SAM-dependent methyltransferase